MKLKNTKWIALLAVAGFAISTQAAVPITNGDLVFGVRDSTGANSNVYLFDLGAAPPDSGNVASGLSADLSALFGANWYTNTNLNWGIFGYTPANSLYVGRAEATYGTQVTGYSGAGFSSSGRNTLVTKFNNVDTQYGNGSTNDSADFASGGTSASGGVAVDKAAVNGYASFMPSFGGVFGGFEATGFTGTALDVFLINGTAASNSIYQGSYTVDSNGDIVFSATPPSTATPEAGSALSLMALGLGCLVTLRRRLMAKTA